MDNASLQAELKRQEQARQRILTTSDRAKSALALAEMALKHGSSSAEAAAQLLLSMEFDYDFDFKLLLTFDSQNRAHADLVMMGYQAHEIWPSKWMTAIGHDGENLMDRLNEKWHKDSEQ